MLGVSVHKRGGIGALKAEWVSDGKAGETNGHGARKETETEKGLSYLRAAVSLSIFTRGTPTPHPIPELRTTLGTLILLWLTLISFSYENIVFHHPYCR